MFLKLILNQDTFSGGLEVECIPDGVSDELCTSDFERASVVRQVFEM